MEKVFVRWQVRLVVRILADFLVRKWLFLGRLILWLVCWEFQILLGFCLLFLLVLAAIWERAFSVL